MASYIAGEALSAWRRVKFNGTAKTVIYADAEHDAIGVTQEAAASGANVNVKLRTAPGTHKVTAAGAVSIEDAVYGADDGKVDDDRGTRGRVSVAVLLKLGRVASNHQPLRCAQVQQCCAQRACPAHAPPV